MSKLTGQNPWPPNTGPFAVACERTLNSINKNRPRAGKRPAENNASDIKQATNNHERCANPQSRLLDCQPALTIAVDTALDHLIQCRGAILGWKRCEQGSSASHPF